MKNKRQTSLINILSLALVLVSLFMPIIGSSGSWFKYASSTVNYPVVISVSGVNFQLYHTSTSSSSNLIDNTTTFIPLAGAIVPGENDLTLIVENTELVSCYVKFKFEIYVCTIAGDIPLHCTVSSTDSITDMLDGFYAWGGTSSGTAISSNSTATLMTSFTIDYDDFADYVCSDTIKIQLEVIAQSSMFA